MNILQISPQVPYPLVDGGKIGIFNITKSLADRGNRITMLAFDRAVGQDYHTVRRYCDLYTVPHSIKNTLTGVFRNAFSSLPYNISKYHSQNFERAARGLITENAFDVVHVDHLHMAEYGVMVRKLSGTPVVLREHNVEYTIMERYATTLTNPVMRLYIEDQLKRIRRYESVMLKEVDCCCAITDVDADRIRGLQPSATVATIPAGVDASLFGYPLSTGQVPESMVFFGSLDWLPNQDAVHWFIDRVLPIVKTSHPNAKLFVIGKQPPNSIKSLECESIIVRGYVPDLHNELRNYQVAIVPIRIGGGLRLKILECFAMRIPVVSTSIGCEGIEAINGRSIIVEDHPERFARSIISLFENETLREKLTQEAFNLASSRYRWEHVGLQFERLYAETIARVARKKSA